MPRDKIINDLVNHPPHYGGDEPYEVIKVMRAWDLEGARQFCRMNAIKYLARDGKKTGASREEDAKKAAWYTAEMVSIDEEISKG